MCGIVGVIGRADAAPLLLEGLRRLEYRGYDSAGVATLVDDQIVRRRAQGKLVNLATVLQAAPLAGTTGIGHTRWATHGAPTEGNAHPHGTARVAVVHNGIIENHAELRAELEAAARCSAPRRIPRPSPSSSITCSLAGCRRKMPPRPRSRAWKAPTRWRCCSPAIRT